MTTKRHKKDMRKQIWAAVQFFMRKRDGQRPSVSEAMHLWMRYGKLQEWRITHPFD